ncbi:GtrA family protein [Paractinoplanes toevensis]|uniref:GtrA family protein n=1 Tax=Paractinoplanes toevensis TaxID=571911 RepID=UPI001FE78F5B|nr:GtrA family protein [Actinoplanes toevensis]
MPDNSTPQPTGLRTRFRALIHELSKFGTVGAISFAIDLAIFNVLLHAGVETLVAKTISTVIATTVAFTGNRFWTWRHRAHDNMARQYTMFFVLNAIGLGIGLSCLAISHYGLGQIWPALQTPLADNISGQLVGTAVGTLFRFWSYRRFVFRDTTPPDQLGTGQSSGRHAANVVSPAPVRDSA